jgi:gamma-glutamyltranspeptidase
MAGATQGGAPQAATGGWMTRADLALHRTEWVEPIRTDYRGVEVYGLGPNTQGLSTNQILNICEQFDLKGMGFQSAASIHHQAEAKRLAFEDRAKWFADDRFSRTWSSYDPLQAGPDTGFRCARAHGPAPCGAGHVRRDLCRLDGRLAFAHG